MVPSRTCWTEGVEELAMKVDFLLVLPFEVEGDADTASASGIGRIHHKWDTYFVWCTRIYALRQVCH
jgi:hypothetical protein